MVKYVYEFGKRWKVEVPRNDIRYLVNRYHVGTPFSEIESDIMARISDPRFTKTIIGQTIEYARIIHTKNMTLYRRVMG